MSTQRPLPLVAFALLAAFVACAAPAATTAEEPMSQASDSVPDLTPPSNARVLCGGHVSAPPSPDGRPGPHISWTAYHVDAEPQVVAEAYKATLGIGQLEATESDFTWRFPVDAPTQVLTVSDAGSPGPWTECSDLPTSGAVVLISSMARPQ